MNALPDWSDRVVRWGLVTLIAFTPFAFGTVEPWSQALMQWGVVTLLLTFLLGRLWRGAPGAVSGLGATGLEVPVGLFLAFCLLQTVPVPMSWLQRVSPGSARLYQPVDLREGDTTGLAEAHVDDGLLHPVAPARRPVSVKPAETRSRVRLVAVFAGLFLLVAWWADRGERIVFLLGTVTVVGFLVALQGLVQYLSWNGKLLWFRRIPPTFPFGPFVNRNHFAGYVEMVIPVAISLAFYLVEVRRRPHRDPDPAAGTRRSGVSASLRPTGTGHWGKGTLAFFAAVLLVVTLFFSQSRGGILSSVIGALILFPVVWRRIGSRVLAWSLAVALPLLVVAFIAWIGPDTVIQQLGSYRGLEGEASFTLRALVWQRMIENLQGFLWVGAGLGAFEDSFAPVAPPGSDGRWDRAHNDYLQALWETGVVGSAFILLAIIVFTRRYWWPALRSRVHPLDLPRVGIAVAILSIAIHSIFDFNLQIGANGFLFALLGGLLVALRRAVDHYVRERPQAVDHCAPRAPVVY
jgi:hypothetical protein